MKKRDKQHLRLVEMLEIIGYSKDEIEHFGSLGDGHPITDSINKQSDPASNAEFMGPTQYDESMLEHNVPEDDGSNVQEEP